jgi:hypothetical protein
MHMRVEHAGDSLSNYEADRLRDPIPSAHPLLCRRVPPGGGFRLNNAALEFGAHLHFQREKMCHLYWETERNLA